MALRGDISLGDLLEAFRELEADESSRLAIARLLKLAPEGVEEAGRAQEDARERAPADDIGERFDEGRASAGGRLGRVMRRFWGKVRAPRGGGEEPEEETQPPTPEPAAAATRREEEADESQADEDFGPVVPSLLRMVGSDRGEVAQPKPGASPLPPDAARDGDARPALEPLLLPVWTRALLSGALSSRNDDGPLDVKKVVERVASGEPSARLPRRPRPTLARGVQVLVDRGETMLPFFEDQEGLEGEIKKVVGEGRAQILYFDGNPARKAGPGSRSGWKTYTEHHMPRAGTVVLLLTDLGVGRPLSPFARTGEREWVAFAERLRRRGCPLVAFVPYAPRRVPASLRRLVTVLQWDRSTSASSVHASVGKGHVSWERSAT